MGREKPIRLSSEAFASELDSLLDTRGQALNQADAEIDKLLDKPEQIALEKQASYREVFYDTPAKKLLGYAEDLLPVLEEKTSKNWYLDKYPYQTLTIDIAEAYGTVMPDEGWRLVQQLPDSPEKVEALARFGAVTDPEFVSQAKRLALQLESNNYYARHRMFLVIAKYTGDADCLRHVYDSVTSEIQRLDPFEWDYVSGMLELASLGHYQALLNAKAFIMEFNRTGHSSESSHWIKEAALAEYIDELIQRGEIGIIIPSDENDPAANGTRVDQWKEFLQANHDAIVTELKKGVSLPVFESFANEFGIIQHEIEDCTSLKEKEDTLEYIADRVDEYTQQLTDGHEPQKVFEKTRQADKRFLRDREELKREYEEATDSLDRMGASWVVGPSTLEGDIAIHDRQFEELIPFLNGIALVQATCRAAVAMNSEKDLSYYSPAQDASIARGGQARKT